MLASSQFLICAAQSGPLTDVHGVIQRRGRKETEVARRIKGEIKRRETDPASNQFPKCSPNPFTSHNSLLDTSLHSREKKSSSTHQNTDTRTSHPENPTHSEETPQ